VLLGQVETRARLVATLRARAAAETTAESVEPGPGGDAPEPSRAGFDTAETTVGTGSAFAIGCTAIVLVVTVIGVLILLATRWV
jgi:hypothetical protein